MANPVRVPTKGTHEWDDAVAAGLIVPNTGGGTTPTPVAQIPAARWTLDGDLTVRTGTKKYAILADCKLSSATLSLAAAASGTVTIDVNNKGVSAFPDQTTRPKIGTAITVPTKTTLAAPVQLRAGDYLTLDVDTIGGAVARSLIGSSAFLASGATGGNTVNRTANAAPGDIHIAFVNLTVGGNNGDNPSTRTAVTPPAGWAEIGTSVRAANNAAARNLETHAFWWKDDGTQTAWTFTPTQPTSNVYMVTRVVTVRGASGIDGYASNYETAAAASATAPSVYANSTNEVLICAWFNPTVVQTTTVPTGFTQVGAIADRMQIGYKELTDAGGTGAQALGGTLPTNRYYTEWSIVLATKATGDPGNGLTVALEFIA